GTHCRTCSPAATSRRSSCRTHAPPRRWPTRSNRSCARRRRTRRCSPATASCTLRCGGTPASARRQRSPNWSLPVIDRAGRAPQDAGDGDRRMNATAPALRRAAVVLRAAAPLSFAALLVAGPLAENTARESLFAATLVLIALVGLLFAGARVGFALLATSIAFGKI